MAKDYAAIARQRISRPSQQKRFPRIFIYSRNKKGKSTLLTTVGVDKILILDPEHGTDEMKKKDPHVWHIERWEDIDEAYQFLRHEKHDYQWVGVDAMTKLANMALKYVMKLQEEKSLDRIPGMVQQRDYGKAGELMKEMLNQFQNLPLGVIFTANERMVENSDDSEEDEDVEGVSALFLPDLPKGVRGSITSMVDVIGRLYIVKNDDGKAERRLWIGESLKYDTGYRSDYTLPDFIRNPTIPKLVRLMRTGSATATPKTSS